MRYSFKKTVVAAVAALGMATAVASMPTPAEAQWHGGGGFHGGFGGGGFHGGFGGGGFRGGWGGGGWRGGWGGWRGGYGNRGCWNCGYGWWWPGFATGAIIGAAATYPYSYDYGYPYYGGGYGYGADNGCWAYRRVYTRHGHYLGRRLVNLCS